MFPLVQLAQPALYPPTATNHPIIPSSIQRTNEQPAWTSHHKQNEVLTAWLMYFINTFIIDPFSDPSMIPSPIISFHFAIVTQPPNRKPYHLLLSDSYVPSSRNQLQPCLNQFQTDSVMEFNFSIDRYKNKWSVSIIIQHTVGHLKLSIFWFELVLNTTPYTNRPPYNKQLTTTTATVHCLSLRVNGKTPRQGSPMFYLKSSRFDF